MRYGKRIILFLIGIVALGSGAPVYAQTGDCHDPLPGCLDDSFGAFGKVTAPPGMTIYGLAIQHIGGEARIVAVGEIYLPGEAHSWAIARYHADGTLDTSFGNGGIVQKSFKKGSGRANAVVVQADNQLVVAGNAPAGNMSSLPTVARYNVDGSPDATFGGNGWVQVTTEGRHAGYADGVVLQSDGKIVGTGCYIYQCRLAVFRLNPDGSLDPSFNGGNPYVHTSAVSEGFAVAVQTVGAEERIVVAGTMVTDSGYASAALFRFNANGTLDASFGGSGVAVTDFDGFASQYHGLGVVSGNRLVAVASADGWPVDLPGTRLAMARYLEDGTPDSSFGVGGKILPPPRLVDGVPRALALQSDGKILVAGHGTGFDGHEYMEVWRFTDDGAPDPTFGTAGWVTNDFFGTGYNVAEALTLQPDGKFLVGGFTGLSQDHKAALARYFGTVTQTDHDVAVYNISATPSAAIQGNTITVQVTVGNNGTNAETADVTVTESPDGAVLGTQSIAVAAGGTADLTFTWVTSTSTTADFHTLVATATLTTSGVTDEQPANNSGSTEVSVAPVGVGIVLSAYGYRVNGRHRVDLSWTGASTEYVELYRDGAFLKTVTNTGAYTDDTRQKGQATYLYQVCDAGGARCSNIATVVF